MHLHEPASLLTDRLSYDVTPKRNDRKPRSYLFGPYRLDVSRRLLYAGSTPTPMPERLFQILLALIEAGGDVITRESLASHVWSGAGVTDTNVNQHVYLLRMLLGERKNERSYIITIPGIGYRFAAPVTAVDPWLSDEEDVALGTIASLQSRPEGANDLFALYCRGSYQLDRGTGPLLRAAAESFEAALRMDADYVPALVGLGRAHALMAEFSHVAPGPAFDKAKSAVARALHLEPRSATVHALRSEVHLFADWDWARAGRAALSAITLNPQSSFARENAARYHCCRGDSDRALTEATQALMVEPASLQLQLLQGRVLVHAGSYAESIACFNGILAVDPNYCAAKRYRAQAYVFEGRFSEALEDLGDFTTDPSDDLGKLPLLARALVGVGDNRHALDIYTQLQARSQKEYVALYNLAIIASGLGRQDEALHLLQRALQNREPTMLSLRTLPWFKLIERRPEFARILREIGPRSPGVRGEET